MVYILGILNLINIRTHCRQLGRILPCFIIFSVIIISCYISLKLNTCVIPTIYFNVDSDHSVYYSNILYNSSYSELSHVLLIYIYTLLYARFVFVFYFLSLRNQYSLRRVIQLRTTRTTPIHACQN